MKRLIWLGLGAATGFLTVHKIRDIRKSRDSADSAGSEAIATAGRGLAALRAFIKKFLQDAKRAAAKQEAALFTALETQAAVTERARSAAAEPVYSGRHAAH